MNSWTATIRIAAVMGAVAIAYLVGRWVAETLQELVAGGVAPGL